MTAERKPPDLNRRLAAKMYVVISDDLDAAAGRINGPAGFGQKMPVQEGVQAMRPSDLLKQPTTITRATHSFWRR